MVLVLAPLVLKSAVSIAMAQNFWFGYFKQFKLCILGAMHMSQSKLGGVLFAFVCVCTCVRVCMCVC